MNVTNVGVELNDLAVNLRIKRQREDQKEIWIPLIAHGEYPKAFKFGYSVRFQIETPDPIESIPVLKADLKDIDLLISSGVRIVKTVNAKKWKKQLAFVCDPQPHLPKPPAPPQRHQRMISPGEWMSGRPKW
ncbi:MAG: hypothetical protein QM770_01100 [Tepidisphaeraceae bacterium]